MTTDTVQAATLADTLLEKLRAGWRRPDLSIAAEAFGEGVVLSIAPVHMPGEYTYIIQRHLAATVLRRIEHRGALDDLVAEILYDMDAIPAVACA